jgi:ATP-grasp domain-containing protein
VSQGDAGHHEQPPDTRRVIVVVDGYSTGHTLAPAFHAYGAYVVHAQSSAEVPPVYRRHFHPEHYDLLLRPGTAAQAAAELRRRGLDPGRGGAVLAGTDTGVMYADELAAALGLRWNSPQLSTARRHKYEMTAAVRQAGLPCARQLVSRDIGEIEAWARQETDWPIVVKPPLSFRSDDVFFCRDVGQLRAAWQTILDKVNLVGIRNEAVVAQSFLAGEPNYAVNSVSLDGEHLVSDVWQFDFIEKPTGGIRFIRHRLLTERHEYFDALASYDGRVLDALGVRNGPTHSEHKCTQAGPRMIEVNSRLMGATLEDAPFMAALGRTQTRLTAMGVCDPAAFRRELARPYRVNRHLSIVWAYFTSSKGVITGDEGCAAVERLPSFAGWFGRPAIGQQVNSESEEESRAGYLYLLNDDPIELDRDEAAAIHRVWSDALFTVA